MITAPIKTPKKGMIVFSENRGLMARVTGVTEEGFRFRVMNGGWNGEVGDGKIRIEDRSFRSQRARGDLPTSGEDFDRAADLGPNDFRRVLSVTRDDFFAWYMQGEPGASALIDRVVPEQSEKPSTHSRAEAAEDQPYMDPVQEATITLTILGQADSPQELENWITSMSLEGLAREIDEGDLIGMTKMVGTVTVPPGQVRHRLEDLGNDGSFFEDAPAPGRREDLAGAITTVRDAQGWNDGSMTALAAEFIREAGLERAFLAHIEEKARMENEVAADEPDAF